MRTVARPGGTMTPPDVHPAEPVLLRTVGVIGTGLIGTSIALALRERGVTVHLSDRDPEAARCAATMGAGTVEPCGTTVDLGIIAVPPTAVGAVLAEAQAQGLAQAYTDVASTKARPYRDAVAAGCGTATFVGGHPMAGSEASGPTAARPGLFVGRPWVLTPGEKAGQYVRAAVAELVELCSAVPVIMDPEHHDRAVALISHAPHVLSTLMAARLEHLDGAALGLAGRGVRDVTRIAGGDPMLWADILSSNASVIADILDFLVADMASASTALRSLGSATDPEYDKAGTQLVDLLARGRAGYDRLNPLSEGADVAR
ncbi:prephenate dehydrogenase [Streptomyces prunicolor]|uniref:Prephenate dehydrogenase n=1 Tax=Streptomyces prunicolor TaxID=67348 RepID=A0ABU4FH89_9ACTN|nr:prephenate dehydrogenase [Streptomyces prunicolor]MCX5243619.1 prephenate dehydrogenase [Streptomyces prunicolor]MDV7219368.1 prephenate dehydrogenase [Streptomyces prunicolor]